MSPRHTRDQTRQTVPARSGLLFALLLGAAPASEASNADGDVISRAGALVGKCCGTGVVIGVEASVSLPIKLPLAPEQEF